MKPYKHTGSCRVNYREAVCTCGADPLDQAPADALAETVIAAMKHHTIQGAFGVLQDGRRALDELVRRAKIETAARALYEQVEMDESVGVCLSDRVAALNLGQLLCGPVEVRGEPFDPQLDYPERYGRRP